MMIFVAVLVLGVLIFVHELGHFLVAKSCGVGVLDFAIGFGKKIWTKRIGETKYAIGIVPLGGYVRMVGDEPSQLETWGEDQEKLDPVEKKLMQDEKRWFLKKPLLARAAIVIAGPAFNLGFALLLAIFSFYVYGKSVVVDKPVIGGLVPDFPAEKSGLRVYDFVKSVDGREMLNWSDLAETIGASRGKSLSLLVVREEEGQKKELEIKIAGQTDSAEMKLLEGSESGVDRYKIGIMPDFSREPIAFTEALQLGSAQLWFVTQLTAKGLWGMLSGVISPKHIAGPIFIFKEAAQTAKRGFEHLLDFVVFLSVSLAVLNLLPIPVLDGGHLLFFIIEGLKGSPLSIKAQAVANQVGMFILLMLMVFAVGNDILRLVG